MGLTLFWKMPVKQHTNMTTLQICWTMAVESATSLQNWYGWRWGFRRRWSRKVEASV
jgi:hypothetical protein